MFASVYQQIRFAQSAILGDFIEALWWLIPHFVRRFCGLIFSLFMQSPCLNILLDVSLDVKSLTLFEVDIYYKEALPHFYHCAYGCTREISFRNWLIFFHFAYSVSYSTPFLNRNQHINRLGTITTK